MLVIQNQWLLTKVIRMDSSVCSDVWDTIGVTEVLLLRVFSFLKREEHGWHSNQFSPFDRYIWFDEELPRSDSCFKGRDIAGQASPFWVISTNKHLQRGKKKIHHLPKERWLCKVGGGDGKGGGWVHQRREVYISKVENEKQIFFSIFVCPEFWCVDLPLAQTKDLDSHVNNPLNNAAIVWILAR